MVDIQISAVHPRMGSPEFPWPCRKSEQAAGWDCVAAIDEPIELWPGQLVKVPLGFAMALPPGWEAQIRPRSGLASRGLAMPNSPGTVDADYRGEVSVLLFNLELVDEEGADPRARPSDEAHLGANIWIQPGDRVCQMIIAPVPEVRWVHCARDALTSTERGSGGFGSTGVST